jgi:hypothetical protein
MLGEFCRLQGDSKNHDEGGREFSAGLMVPDAECLNVRAIRCQYGRERLEGNRVLQTGQSEKLPDN